MRIGNGFQESFHKIPNLALFLLSYGKGGGDIALDRL